MAECPLSAPVSLRSATIQDASTIAEVAKESLKTSPWWSWYFYSPKTVGHHKTMTKADNEAYEIYVASFSSTLCSANKHAFIAMLDGEPAGFAIWTSPSTLSARVRKLSWSETIVSNWFSWKTRTLAKLPVWLYIRLFHPTIGDYPAKRRESGRVNAEFFESGLSDNHKDAGYWMLSWLCVSPAAQRRGVGSALLEWGMEKAREDGMAVYLGASPEGKLLYEKHGFKSTAHIIKGKDSHAGEWQEDVMVWTAELPSVLVA